MKNYILVTLLAVLFIMLTGTALAENVKTYDAEAFRQALEQDGFAVQEGELGYFDLEPVRKVL